MRGEDRMALVLFFMTLDEMMGHVAEHYSKLKQAWADSLRSDYPPLTIIEQLMEAAVATNLGIQQVAALEQKLMTDFPHLDTVYRLLAVLVLPSYTVMVTELVTSQSPRKEELAKTHAVEFIGDVLECGFRNASDKADKSDSVIQEFMNTWQLSDKQEFDLIFRDITHTARMEAPLKQEMAMSSQFFEFAASMGIASHSWLPKSTFIGQDRSIIHTIRLLQGLGGALQYNERPRLKSGYFGRQWGDERSKQASKFQIDMDEFLMGDVMPLLVSMCYEGLLSSDLPYQEELLPLFVHIKSFVNHPERPVSVTLAYAVHTLLTSVYELQGHVHSLADTANQSFDMYFRQIEWNKELHKQERPGLLPRFGKNLDHLYKLRWLVVPPIRAYFTQSQVMRATFNPLCAGTFLSYVAYFGNLNIGSCMLDCTAQLRIVLHLFNALLKNGVFHHGQLELLDLLYETFRDSKSIWEGSIPEKGQFVKRWWISFGTSIEESRRRSESTRRAITNPSGTATHDDPGGNITRKMTPLEPEDISKSYRRICLRDFSGVVDKYHTDDQRRNVGHTDFYRHAVRVNDTLDAMEEDEWLLATNLTSLGELLSQFFYSLFRVLEWERYLDECVRHMIQEEAKRGRRADGSRVVVNSWETGDENLKYQAMILMFAEKLLGTLDFNEAASSDTAVARTAVFMQMYFTRIEREQFMYFIPVREETVDK